jgi:hypothetical protein
LKRYSWGKKGLLPNGSNTSRIKWLLDYQKKHNEQEIGIPYDLKVSLSNI